MQNLSTCGDGTAFPSVSDRLIEIIKIAAARNHPLQKEREAGWAQNSRSLIARETPLKIPLIFRPARASPEWHDPGSIRGRVSQAWYIPEVDGRPYCAVTAGEYKRNCTTCDDVGDRIDFFAAYIDIQNGKLEISRFRKIQRDSNIARFRDDRVTQLFNHPAIIIPMSTSSSTSKTETGIGPFMDIANPSYAFTVPKHPKECPARWDMAE